ncbi:hypothetical protein GOP47_0013938 [Adiantum capillus-veneris]|uniref:Mitochondrial import receptor subunit TOM20 n=1 Tax=Adiantum capillus-veneris TaxID=13818 RepID=A0A9D4UPY5_ADICA|nr:hypothetical protein GOP47_0013938 [Adiantum capillus-veneris]
MEDMSLPAEEYQRLLFFESARDKAAETYQHAPEDSDNLTRWGGALLELSQIQQGQHSLDLVKDAVSKLEEARNINPLKSDTLWCLGNAYTTHGFLIREGSLAKDYFQKASGCFLQALELEPNNELFQKALEMSAKAPALHEKLQSQLTAQPDHFDAAAGVPERGHTVKLCTSPLLQESPPDLLRKLLLPAPLRIALLAASLGFATAVITPCCLQVLQILSLLQGLTTAFCSLLLIEALRVLGPCSQL